MIGSNLYNYVDVLDKAADASWLRQEAISNNIANQDTPGYKRVDVDFESVLEQELTESKYVSLDKKIGNIHMGHLNVGVKTDSAGYSYRLDGNNVDPEQEYVQLASTQLKYNALVDTISSKFNSIKSVIK